MQSAKSKTVLRIVLILIVAGLVILFVNLKSQNQTITTNLAKTTSSYKEIKSTVKSNANHYTLSEDSDVIKAKSTVKKFASTYFTYSSSTTYNARQDKLASVINLSDEQMNALFDKANEAKQDERIENLSLTSEFTKITGSSAGLGSDKSNVEVVSIVSVKAGSNDIGTKLQKLVIHAVYDINSGRLTSIEINQIV